MTIEISEDQYYPKAVYICDYCGKEEEFDKYNSYLEAYKAGWKRTGLGNHLNFCCLECRQQYTKEYVEKHPLPESRKHKFLQCIDVISNHMTNGGPKC